MFRVTGSVSRRPLPSPGPAAGSPGGVTIRSRTCGANRSPSRSPNRWMSAPTSGKKRRTTGAPASGAAASSRCSSGAPERRTAPRRSRTSRSGTRRTRRTKPTRNRSKEERSTGRTTAATPTYGWSTPRTASGAVTWGSTGPGGTTISTICPRLPPVGRSTAVLSSVPGGRSCGWGSKTATVIRPCTATSGRSTWRTPPATPEATGSRRTTTSPKTRTSPARTPTAPAATRKRTSSSAPPSPVSGTRTPAP